MRQPFLMRRSACGRLLSQHADRAADRSGLLSEERQTRIWEGRNHMRLDKYLKVSRLIKRRTVANEACDAGRVLVNGKPAKASVSVKEGDEIEIQFGGKAVKVEVLSVQETIRKEDAAEMYRYL